MRLLNVHSLSIREFIGDHVPRYAILSHTWGEEEVSFKDMVKCRAAGLKGYQKILGCCKQACLDGFEYVWIDTCCIDKRSSAELSEAINSMYRWYQESEVCYAYLEDVSDDNKQNNGDGGDSLLRHEISRNRPKNNLPFGFLSSRWFTRGWTLQELIAPPFVVFYSKEWSCLGTRSALKATLAMITGISAAALTGGYPKEFSVAEKMSWASNRNTTRPEDAAYCLLGLFGVYMPLVYGEGVRAFRRLQEEIIRYSDDETIFTHGSLDAALLGRWSTAFGEHGVFRCSKGTNNTGSRISKAVSPFSVTNKGIQISLPLIKNPTGKHDLLTAPKDIFMSSEKQVIPAETNLHLAILNCHEVRYEDRYIAIFIQETENRGVYAKISPWLVSIPAEVVKQNATVKRILLRTDGYKKYQLPDKTPTERLIVVQPFPTALTPVTFMAPLSACGRRLRKYQQENDSVTVEVSLSSGFIIFESNRIINGEPTALVCNSGQSCDILISLGFASENVLMAAIGCIDSAARSKRPAGESWDEWILYKAKMLLEASLIKPTIAFMPRGDSNTESVAVTATVRNTEHTSIVTIHAE